MSVATPETPTPVHSSERPAQSLFQREIVTRALIDSFKKLDPRVQIRNPVMFVVEIGAAITTVTWLIQVFGGKPLGGGNEPAWYTFTISFWLWLTVVFANMAEAFAEGRGRAQADALRATRQETVARLQDGTTKQASELAKGDVVVVEAGRADPGRRDRDRGDRVGRRVGDHRRVGARDPRVRRRPQRRHRRHPRALGPDRRRDHAGARRLVSGSDDRAGRRRRAAQDAERDRAQHPARGADPDLHDRRRDAAAVRALLAHRDLRHDPDLAAGRADPDHDRRAAVGDRDRRHRPARAPQRACALRARGRGIGRRRRAAARQDRHDHDRQPARVASSSRCRACPRPSSPRSRSSRRSPTRRPRAARSSCSQSSTGSASTTWPSSTRRSSRSRRRPG